MVIEAEQIYKSRNLVEFRFGELIEILLISRGMQWKANVSLTAQDSDVTGKVSGHLCHTILCCIGLGH